MEDGGPMQTVEMPMYDNNFETNVPGLYLVGEATGKALIKVAINQGKKVIESILEQKPESIEKIFPLKSLEGVDPAEAAIWIGVSRVLLNLEEFITRG